MPFESFQYELDHLRPPCSLGWMDPSGCSKILGWELTFSLLTNVLVLWGIWPTGRSLLALLGSKPIALFAMPSIKGLRLLNFMLLWPWVTGQDIICGHEIHCKNGKGKLHSESGINMYRSSALLTTYSCQIIFIKFSNSVSEKEWWFLQHLPIDTFKEDIGNQLPSRALICRW